MLRAPSAYNLFVKAAASSSGAASRAEGASVMTRAAAQWRALSPGDRARWEAAAAAEKAKFAASRPAPPPKKAPNAYALFVRDRFAAMPAGPAPGRMAAVAAEWRAMGAAAKAQYVARAAAGR